MRLPGFAVAVAMSALLATLPVAAQANHSVFVTLVTDPAGDQVVAPNPCLSTSMPKFPGADVVSVSLAGPAPSDAIEPPYTLFIGTSAAVPATQTTTLHYTLEKGPTSYPFSKATGQSGTLTFKGTAAPSGFGTVVVGADGIRYNFIPGDLHAVGGDRLTNVSVETSDTDGGALPITQDDCTGTDRAPNQGATGSFTFYRPAPQGAVTVRVLGGVAQLSNGTLSFSGTSLTVAEAPRALRLDVALENKALDPDTILVAVGGAVKEALLKAGASTTLSLTLNRTFTTGTSSIAVQATSTLGGGAQASFTLTVGAPPAAPREVIPAGLAFLTPLATGAGLDVPFGSYAELFLLLAALVVVVVILFLALTLARTPWVKGHAEPTHVTAAAGGSAQVQVAVDKLRHGVERVRAVLRSPGGWPASLGGKEAVDLAADGSATLRVDVPSSASPKDRQTIEVDLVPIGADGIEHPERAAHTRVTVQAGLPSTPLGPGYAVAGIQLAGVRHEPSQPRPGETVTTTATVRNGGAAPAPLRVALVVDGQVRGERRIEVPARSAVDVPLQWVAGAGANQVKVQVFLA